MTNQEIIEKYILAGKIACEARKYGISLVKDNTSILEVCNKIEDFIISNNAEIAFPVNICINNVSAHFTPSHDYQKKFKYGDVVKIDVGAHIDGYIGDTAETIEIGTTNYKSLIEATKEALEIAIEIIKPGISLNLIGKAIEDRIKSYGFKPISNLTGHSMDRYILHSGKSVPNIGKFFEIKKPSVGDIFAIEPFATNGYGKVNGNIHGNIYKFIKMKKYFSAETIALLEFINKKYCNLPFAERWCTKIIENPKRNLDELAHGMSIYSYPVLNEVTHGIVAQSEHTVIITENGCKVITD